MTAVTLACELAVIAGRSGTVARHTSSGRCPTALEDEIRQALTRAGGRLSTAELAKAVSADRNLVYRSCCRMQEGGELQSAIEEGPNLLFCVDHKAVVTRAIFEECKALAHQFVTFPRKMRVWSLRIAVARAGRQGRRQKRTKAKRAAA